MTWQTFSFTGTPTGSFYRPVEDPRLHELRRRVLERANANQRFVRYVLDTYGGPHGEPFFQDLCARERELQAEIARRSQPPSGAFVPAAGQTPVAVGVEPQPPVEVPLVVEEVAELEFLPYLRAAARRFRRSPTTGR